MNSRRDFRRFRVVVKSLLTTKPVSRAQILLGKFLPCLVISVAQGLILLIVGKLALGMRWGPDNWSLGQQIIWLLPVMLATSVTALGLAMLVAALARNEVQVAIYGAVPVLVLALIGGCVLPREMMPERTQQLTLLSPLGWALDAYRELLVLDGTSDPNLEIVVRGCVVLAIFGVGFVGLAWWALRLE